jgi:hypothetical protein
MTAPARLGDLCAGRVLTRFALAALLTLSLLVVAPASSDAHEMSDTWSIGSDLWGNCGSKSGGWVMAIQGVLLTHHINIGSFGPHNNGVDGSWGSASHNGVRSWQSIHNLSVDGCVGTQTWNNMRLLGTHRTWTGSIGNQKTYYIHNHHSPYHSSYRETRYFTRSDITRSVVEISRAGTQDASYGLDCRRIHHSFASVSNCKL